MRVVLQVVLPVLCGIAGYWMAVSREEVGAGGGAVLAESERGAEVKVMVSPVRSISVPVVGSEAWVALLTPENWAEAISPLSQLRLDELPAVLHGLLRNPFPDVKWRLLRYVFERWAALDRAGALAAMRGLASPQHKESALRAILSIWTQTDANGAWQWVTALEDDSVLQEAGIENLLAKSTAQDPLAYAEWADQIDDVFLREKALRQIGDSWMRNDAKGALAAVLTVEPERLRSYLLSKLCYREGVDYAVGLEAVAQIPTRAERSALNAEWIGVFVKLSAEGALEWVKARANNPELQQSGSGLGAGLASSAKSAAELRAQLLQLPAGPLRDATVATAASVWAERGHSKQEARDLLSLCGPCIERHHEEERIESAGRP